MPRISTDIARLGHEAPDIYKKLNDTWAPAAAKWIEERFPAMVQKTAAAPQSVSQGAPLPPGTQFLVTPLPDGDVERVCTVSHRLAGAALNLGATHGGEAARQLEHSLLSGLPVDDAAQALPPLRRAVTQDLEALLDYRARLVAMTATAS